MPEWNNVCAYSTGKLVKIKDWRLGFLHYFAQFCIFCYVIVTVILERGFMATEQIVGGSITLNSQIRREDSFAFSQNGNNGYYKSVGADSSSAGYGGASSTYANATYCCPEPATCVNSTSELDCLYWDEMQAECVVHFIFPVRSWWGW
jgi:hypothetical protein